MNKNNKTQKQYPEIIKILRSFSLPSFVFFNTTGLAISYSYYNQGLLDIYTVVTSALLLIFSLILLIKWSFIFKNRRQVLFLFTLLVLLFLITGLRVSLLTVKNNLNINEKKQSGEILSISEVRYGKQFLLNIMDENFESTKVKIYTEKDFPYKKGDFIEFSSKIGELSAKNDYGKNLLRNGIFYSTFISSSRCRLLKADNGKSKISPLKHFKVHLVKKIKSLFSYNSNSFLTALLFGNKSLINKRSLLDLKKSGLLHAIALSGLHVGFISFIPLLLLKLLNINQKLNYIIISIILICYMMLTNMPVSLIRAALMFFLYGFQYIFNIEKNILNTLFLSAIIIALLFPFEIFSLGFQLSYGAMVGIILFYKRIKSILPEKLSFISNSLALSFSAQVIVMPIILIRLNEINFSGFLTGIFFIPIIFLALVSSFTAIGFSFLSFNYFQKLTDILFNLTVFSTGKISTLPVHFSVEKKLWLLIPYSVFLIPLFTKKIPKKICRIFFISALAISFIPFYINSSNSRDEVLFFKENQQLIVLKNNKDIMIYGNISSDMNIKKLVKYVTGHSFNNISLYMTDTKFKNMNFHRRLLKKIPVSRCYFTSGFTLSRSLTSFFKILEADNIPLRIIQNKKNSIGKTIKPIEKEVIRYFEIEKKELMVDKLIINLNRLSGRKFKFRYL